MRQRTANSRVPILRFALVVGLLVLALLAISLANLPYSNLDWVAYSQPYGPDGAGVLTLLHNNDGESSLLPLTNSVATGTETISLPVGGVAAFKTLTDQNIAEARAAGHAVIDVYAGDAFLASATLVCGQDPAQPIYDAVAQRQIPYDAHILGNHEFDYFPDFLEEFIRAFSTDGLVTQPFLSANLDFSGEPGFADLIDADGVINVPITDGRVIGHSAIVTDTVTGQRFGIVSATTWTLPTISSPRNVRVTTSDLETTAAAVQAEIDRLYDDYGVRKIIFVSHLQDIDNDQALIGMVRKVDVAVAGGGSELLENPAIPDDMELLPGERAPVQGTYPLTVTDPDGRSVPIVTTTGNYKYLGRLDVEFDDAGEVTRVITETSYPRRVIPDSPEADALGLTDTVTPDSDIVTTVNEPLEACLESLATTKVATTEVLLDVSRAGVRSTESNAGNMIADSFIFAYDRFAADLGLPPRGADNPVIAVTNGGGIRQNAGDVLPVGGVVPGDITRKNTLDVLPFPNFVTVINNVTPDDLKTVFERSAESLPGSGGQFLQVSGLTVTYNVSRSVGSRVVSVVLSDGTPIIQDGAVVEGAPNVRVVTNSFVARGGDGYESFGNNPDQLQLGLSYEQAWREYMELEGGLGGLIRADDPRYQPGGEGRIVFVREAPTPTPTPTPTATPQPTATPTPPPPPAGTGSLTARVYIDHRCDSFFQHGVDIPIGNVSVTLTFPNGATITRQTRPFGLVNFSGFDPSGGVTVSAELPRGYKGISLDSCPGSSASIDVSPGEFQFRYKFVQFRLMPLGEEAGP
ncbi:MAG: bifunctional metallophosphatase/5'-nucleotidase [Chloroflexi bacterium]|nr:MAG: bifunctional metallophosphatase/5'-nucleotidase [Chloroflexota bacterium]